MTTFYGSTSVVIQSATAGILDSGTTLILLATDAFNTYKTLTGAVEDENTGLLRVLPLNAGSIRTIGFLIGGVSG